MANEIQESIRHHFRQERENAEKHIKRGMGLSPDDALPAYEHQEFPKWVHFDDGRKSVLVHTPDEEKQHTAKPKSK